MNVWSQTHNQGNNPDVGNPLISTGRNLNNNLFSGPECSFRGSVYVGGGVTVNNIDLTGGREHLCRNDTRTQDDPPLIIDDVCW